MESRFIEKLSPLKLTARQFGVLQYLEEHPHSSQKQVGEALQIDRTTMVSHIDYLEEIQYAQRVKNPKDRRSFVLKISKLGQEKLRLGRSHLENTEMDVLSGLTDKEQKELKSILLRVWSTIQGEEK
ncbi:MarR family winged helix-turn-helix transcriptional regulator [Halobacillus naozhouensis]|uniref:MarR family transcriptional regulator n=1 Tax=Halobacillus naozhouensis TaxID=554880 RepID=A0ABY8J1Z1_9BACI|nr:MarR family transcriptional regulator [Halobacillus naozhouensis]WFT76518.1 MarR family transcriptional regulator [Halobacillus naozhouensis]